MSEIVTRPEAIKRGLRRYNTGKPCCYGHRSDRYIRDGGCIQCQRERDAGIERVKVAKAPKQSDHKPRPIAPVDERTPAERRAQSIFRNLLKDSAASIERSKYLDRVMRQKTDNQP